MSEGMRAGQLNQRITLLSLLTSQHPTTGVVTEEYLPLADLWANIRPVSGREYVEAGAQQSKITATIKLRYRSGIKPSMRIQHGETVYNIEAVLRDPYSGLEWITLACSQIIEG